MRAQAGGVGGAGVLFRCYPKRMVANKRWDILACAKGWRAGGTITTHAACCMHRCMHASTHLHSTSGARSGAAAGSLTASSSDAPSSTSSTATTSRPPGDARTTNLPPEAADAPPSDAWHADGKGEGGGHACMRLKRVCYGLTMHSIHAC